MKEFIQKNYKKLIIAIFVLGILFRTAYIIINPIRINQYDCKIWSLYDLEDYEGVYNLNEENIGKAGHMNYIMTIYNTFKLPEGTGGQYYHPPLHHFISAMWLRLMDIFPLNAMQKIESLQVLSLIYSILILFLAYKIMEKINMDEIGKLISSIFINFFPLFIYMSGFVNNDTLITLFIILNLYCLIKWNEKPNIINTIIFALSIGLGMMVKTSIMVMMLPAVLVFGKKYISAYNQKEEKQIKKLIILGIIFAVIALPLSLWHQIRNTVKYDFSMFAIQKPYEHFYSGDASPLERWGLFSKDILKNRVLIEDKNIFANVINSALFCLYENTTVIAYVVKIITVLIGLTSVAMVIRQVIENYKDENMIIIGLTFLAWIFGFAYFNMSLPYSCTMNSRYIPILFIICMIMLGKDTSERKNKLWISLISILTVIMSTLSIFMVLK